MKMSADEFSEAREEYAGYCRKCDDVTTYEVEPDARRYECDECGERAVYGVEEALLMGWIEIE